MLHVLGVIGYSGAVNEPCIADTVALRWSDSDVM